MKYKQLTLKERYHISTLLKKGWSQKEIAQSIKPLIKQSNIYVKKCYNTLWKKEMQEN